MELESDPLQTSVDLTVTRKQDQLANEGGNQDLPLQSDAAEDVGHIETESRDVGSVRSGGDEGEGGREGDGEREVQDESEGEGKREEQGEREGEGKTEEQGERVGEGKREGKGQEEEGGVKERVAEEEEEEGREKQEREGEAEVRELSSSHEEIENESVKEAARFEEDNEPVTDSICQEEGGNEGGSEAEGRGGGESSQTEISHHEDTREQSEQVLTGEREVPFTCCVIIPVICREVNRSRTMMPPHKFPSHLLTPPPIPLNRPHPLLPSHVNHPPTTCSSSKTLHSKTVTTHIMKWTCICILRFSYITSCIFSKLMQCCCMIPIKFFLKLRNIYLHKYMHTNIKI